MKDPMAMVWCVLWTTMIAVTSALGQGSITLRSRLLLDERTDITLGMIAMLEGAEAMALSETVVLPLASIEDGLVIGIGKVREVIEKTPGVNAGRFSIAGNACRVVMRKEPTADLESTTSGLQAVDAPGPTTGDSVQARIEWKLAETYGVQREDLRVTFDERAPSILAASVSGRIVAIELAGTGDRVPVQIRIFEGDRLIENGTVRTVPSVRRRVTRATAAVAKGEVVNVAMLTSAPDWLPPSIVPASIETIVGKAACARIGEGQIVEERHVKPPQVVSRGDICMIDCLSGGLIIQLRARALAHGRTGETIGFQSLSGKRPFQARIAGPERAVMQIEGRIEAGPMAAKELP